LVQCVYTNPAGDTNTLFYGTHMSDQGSTLAPCSKDGPAGFVGYMLDSSWSRSVDLWDRTRGAGFVEYAVIAPTGLDSTRTFDQTGSLTGLSQSSSTASITVNALESPIVNPVVGASAVGVCAAAGLVLLARRRRTPAGRS
jgi:hypothetical protein